MHELWRHVTAQHKALSGLSWQNSLVIWSPFPLPTLCFYLSADNLKQGLFCFSPRFKTRYGVLDNFFNHLALVLARLCPTDDPGLLPGREISVSCADVLSPWVSFHSPTPTAGTSPTSTFLFSLFWVLSSSRASSYRILLIHHLKEALS